MSFKRIIKYYIFFIVIFITFSCKNTTSLICNGKYETYNLNNLDEAEILFPKNQSEGQSLSVVVKSKNGDLIIFDGGRKEDAEYLYNIISDNGGKVSHWFLTHIHDDHIGAIYEILTNEKYKNIKIENLCYHFADFNWYYDMAGDDAGAVLLFNNVLDKYKNINIHNNIKKDEIYNISNVKVCVLNDLYKFESDPINNSSICFNVKIGDISMLVLGDLGYKAGETLYNDISDKNNLKTDILILSHHGQNGVPLFFYENMTPDIIVWPTSRDVYENKNGNYDTDATKEFIKNIKPKYQIFTFETSTILK